MRLTYLLLDVFTRTPLQGNPLAVVLKADDLLDDQMQKIAREFNTSETVFLRRPKSERHTASVRIFTPTTELPFAGHPTVGAAVVLGLRERLSAVRIEEAVGLITSVMEQDDKRTGTARFALPVLPSEVGPPPNLKGIAAALGLMPDDIGCGIYKPSVYSAGVIFYLVPVRDEEVLASVTLERRGWHELFPLGQHSVYVFTETPRDREVQFAARMFSPGMGLDEDPGTGSAAAALLGPIAKHASMADGQMDLKLRQGVEMGRESLISMQFRKSNDELVHGGIGGSAVIVGEGWLDIS